ncbi:hypothetical protein CTEN210_00388 [Chaetoceros tenuissimus]|uniref:subtilisin n=1 Tax=Chaetoceros tenuissimus TaxID=426638 RepID=A0AAD3CE13_9STRA|nr:hypothetical protein CTEN210_00388 [Chaetoceros tenuissimus]
MNGIAWCAVNGANVINLSLGIHVSWSNSHILLAYQDLFEEILNIDDVLVVAAAGNSGVNNLHFPAILPGVVSVGAVDENKQLAAFSTKNYGIELAAPGVNVVSTIPSSHRFGLWAPFSGTSMACPHVAGVAALVWSHFPWISAKTLREVLIQSATDLGDDGRDERFGFGLVDAKAAYDLLASGYTSGPSVEPSSSMSPSQSSSPSSEPSTSIAPSASKSPTSAPTPCDGELLEVVVQTDTKGNETNWNIVEWLSPLTIGEDILSGGKYPENEQILDHQSICLPSCQDDPMSSLYRFILHDDGYDGGASYSILLNGKTIIESGWYFSTMLSTFSTCGTEVFSATLAANPTVALTAVDKMTTSTSKSSKSSRTKYSVALEPYNATGFRQFWLKTNHGYLMNFYTSQCLQHHKGALIMRECKEEKYHLSQSFVFTDDQTIMSLSTGNPAIAVDASDSSIVFEEYLSLGSGPHAGNLWNIQKFSRVVYA